jgi:hypothetical protein
MLPCSLAEGTSCKLAAVRSSEIGCIFYHDGRILACALQWRLSSICMFGFSRRPRGWWWARIVVRIVCLPMTAFRVHKVTRNEAKCVPNTFWRTRQRGDHASQFSIKCVSSMGIITCIYGFSTEKSAFIALKIKRGDRNKMC